jgi:hypothetical protein
MEKLSYKTAIKKKLYYKYTDDPYNLNKLTFSIIKSKTPIKIDTIINGVMETTNVAKYGDILITGPLGEKYVINSLEKFMKLYNIIDEVAITRQIEKQIVKINKKEMKLLTDKNKFIFIAPWGENMKLDIGDYLVKEGSGYYVIEETAFKKTYNWK